MTVATQVMLELQSLPEEQQRQVLKYVERLKAEAKKPPVDPYGACADLRTDLPFEEFQKNRWEMWGDATEKEL